MRISQVIGPRRSDIVEVPDLVPGPSEVLIDVLACGVCASDRTPWREHGRPEEPVRLGHEMVGRVVRTGDESIRWRPGDMVTGLGGRGFAEQALLEASEIVAVPAGIPPEHALGEPLADLIEALARCPLRPGDRVAVVGLGFMGLGLVQLVRNRYPGLLVGVDPKQGARTHALENGADQAWHPDEIPEPLWADRDTGPDQRMDLVLEATGVDAGLAVAGSMVRPYGTLCVIGYHHAGTALMDMGLWYKGATIVNGFGPDRARKVRAMSDGMDLIRDGRFRYPPLITNRFALEQVDLAYELMDDHGPGFVKSVIVP